MSDLGHIWTNELSFVLAKVRHPEGEFNEPEGSGRGNSRAEPEFPPPRSFGQLSKKNFTQRACARIRRRHALKQGPPRTSTQHSRRSFRFAAPKRGRQSALPPGKAGGRSYAADQRRPAGPSLAGTSAPIPR